jgi:hypothetical protein
VKKKMRFALGAALPALGMVAVTTVAPTARAASSRKSVTRVATYAAPDVSPASWNCSQHQTVRTGGNLTFRACYRGFHISRDLTQLNRTQTGLTDRIRFRTTTGALKKQVFINPGTIDTVAGSTFWGSSPNYSAASICTALVANSNHSNVLYGPLCIQTSG